tara:strand:+ start:2429 stop:3406 length:978 start_codon:yes stop_codon:yes gene_type:complete
MPRNRRQRLYDPEKDKYQMINAILKGQRIRIKQGELSPEFTQDQLKKIHRDISQKHHPDKNPASASWFPDYNSLMNELRDPEKKKSYDKARQQHIDAQNRESPAERRKRWKQEDNNPPNTEDTNPARPHVNPAYSWSPQGSSNQNGSSPSHTPYRPRRRQRVSRPNRDTQREIKYNTPREVVISNELNTMQLELTDEPYVIIDGFTDTQPTETRGKLIIPELKGTIYLPKNNSRMKINISNNMGKIVGNIAHEGVIQNDIGEIDITLTKPLEVLAQTDMGEISMPGFQYTGSVYLPGTDRQQGKLTLKTDMGKIKCSYEPSHARV